MRHHRRFLTFVLTCCVGISVFATGAKLLAAGYTIELITTENLFEPRRPSHAFNIRLWDPELSFWDSELSIGTPDPIRLSMETWDQVFKDGGQYVNSSIFINGFDIEWNIFSKSHDGSRFLAPSKLRRTVDIESLPAGDYQLNVSWFDLDSSQETPRRMNSTSFTVVPEPTSLVLSLFGAVGMASGWRRRRKRAG